MKKTTSLVFIGLLLFNLSYGQIKETYAEPGTLNLNLVQQLVALADNKYLEEQGLSILMNNNVGMEDWECPAPTLVDYKTMCTAIITQEKNKDSERRLYEYLYEKHLWTMSCANPTKDSEEEAILKIQTMWNKYKKKFKCDSVNFVVPNGNILKFTFAASSPDVLITFVSNYGLDINFIDPADNLNVLDFVNKQIAYIKTTTNNRSALAVYENYRNILLDLGAVPSK